MDVDGPPEGRGVGPEDRLDGGPKPRADTPAARRHWLLGLAVILLAMIFVPGIVYRLTAPRPLGVTVAPVPPGTSPALAELVAALGPALDRHPTLVFVRWARESPEPPTQADLLVELRPVPRPTPADPGPPGGAGPGDPEGPASAGPAIRLVRRADETVVWEGRATPREGESAAAAVARAVAAAVSGPEGRR